ncbi:malonic semialdehyde reductase [Novispirillum itersonii]|uniref:Putative NADH dehydrogenase/NAD(P)H nitroreductase FHS48_003458 n=1 Tax=Novispirillum itersonii TaxID=189 RepID=A0A7X0DNE6_NOVIT|nr:malonic semialdehyde reductase [Novispirillum itersonii]MBB6212011.1 3-hydroxypropanoate dehydrogenase [Novispirillum itersonii]
MTQTASRPVDAAALDTLFLQAHTHNAWHDRPVDDATLHRLWDLARMPPTAANTQPARLLFVRGADAKDRLRPTLSPGNVDKTMAAPVTVIVAQDLEFYEKLPQTYPQTDARSWYVGKPEVIADNATRNSTLQAAYVLLAARALGLDTGPMTGFNADAIKAAFFPDRPWTANMLINIGYGDPSGIRPRNPRLSFEEACEIL